MNSRYYIFKETGCAPEVIEVVLSDDKKEAERQLGDVATKLRYKVDRFVSKHLVTHDGIFMVCADSFHDKGFMTNFYVTNGETIEEVYGNAFFSKRLMTEEEIIYSGLTEEEAGRVLSGFKRLPTLDVIFDTRKIN